MLSEGHKKTLKVHQASGGHGGPLHRRLEDDAIVKRLLLEVGQDHARPTPARADLLLKERTVNRLVAGREGAMAVGVVGDGQADLLEIVGAGGAPRLLARGLDRRQQEARPGSR